MYYIYVTQLKAYKLRNLKQIILPKTNIAYKFRIFKTKKNNLIIRSRINK